MNDSKRYLKKIHAILPVWGSYEKRFYKDIRSNVTEFCMAHPDYTYSDLEHEFTSPEEIVSHYLTSIDPDYLSRKLSFAKYVKATCTVLISAISRKIVIKMSMMSASTFFSKKTPLL